MNAGESAHNGCQSLERDPPFTHVRAVSDGRAHFRSKPTEPISVEFRRFVLFPNSEFLAFGFTELSDVSQDARVGRDR
ncbi:hypothetical protein Acsp03_71140 [Actinomadura sp. NBRC 104412]|nr:hypothetical protein Acsp03_71140 [Actinomadura sp. NBRC 104412]